MLRADTPRTSLTYDYWPDGRLKTQRDGANAATAYAYDSQARLSSTTDPSGRTTTYGYDLAANLVTKADPGGTCPAWPIVYPPALSPTGACTVSRYDIADQLISVDYSDPATPDVAAIGYDLNGRRTSMTDGTGTSTWAYDSLGRLTASGSGAALPAGVQTTGYGYDLRGHPSSVAYPGPGAPTLTRHFDAVGRMDYLVDWLGKRTDFGYDADSNLTTKTLPATSGVVDTRSFDNAGRLMGMATTKGAATLIGFSYGRDNADQVSSVDSSGAVAADDNTYAYSPLNQLKGVNAASYDYDPADNLKRLLDGSTQAFDAAHQLCWTTPGPSAAGCGTPPAGARTFSYDTRGNRTSATPGSGPSLGYTYDREPTVTASSETAPCRAGSPRWRSSAWSRQPRRPTPTGATGCGWPKRWHRRPPPTPGTKQPVSPCC